MYCILNDVWIEKGENQSEILMKLVLAPMYNIDLENWDIYCIDKIAKLFDKVSKGIHLWLQYL